MTTDKVYNVTLTNEQFNGIMVTLDKVENNFSFFPITRINEQLKDVQIALTFTQQQYSDLMIALSKVAGPQATIGMGALHSQLNDPIEADLKIQQAEYDAKLAAATKDAPVTGQLLAGPSLAPKSKKKAAK